MKGSFLMKSNGSIIRAILDLAKSILGKFIIIHQFHIHGDDVKISLGVKLASLFSIIMTIRIKDNISMVSFNINQKKYKMYFITGKILSAIKFGCVFLKSIVTKDDISIEKLGPVAISKKEYKEIKANKKEMLRKAKERKKRKLEAKLLAKKKEKLKKENEVEKNNNRGPLIIKCGHKNEDYKFSMAY